MPNSKWQMANSKCCRSAAWGAPARPCPRRAAICYLLFAICYFSPLSAAQPSPTSLRERDASADRTIESRRAQIASSKDSDPALSGLLIDQAAALLARPSRDGSDSAVLFGIPLHAQVDAVRADATEAAADLERAKSLADSAHRSLTAAQTPENDPRFDELAQTRTIRIPFYRGRAEALLASLPQTSSASSHAQLAIDALSKLALASAAPESSRRVTYAAALLRRNTNNDAQLALEELAAVATSESAPPGAADTIPAQTRAEAWMGLMHASSRLGTAQQAAARLHTALAAPPFTDGGRPDPLWTVLASDAAAAALTSQSIDRNQPALLDAATSEQSALLARADLGLAPGALRPLIFEKLALLADRAGAAKLPIPAGMRLAQAVIAARDPAKRDDALALFDAVTADPKAGDFAADSLWEQAVLLTQPGHATGASRLRAAQSLTKLAEQFPQNPRAAEAIKAALAYARALESESAAAPEQARAAYLSALALATTRYESLPDIDLWRYERARVLTSAPPLPGAGAASPEAAQRRLADVTAALGQLGKTAPSGPVAENARALHDILRVEQLDALWRDFAALRRTDETRAKALGCAAIRPASEQAVAFARAHQSPFLDRFRADFADALVECGLPGARAIYEDLLARAAPVPGARPRLQLGLARALLLAGDKPGAFPLLHDAAAALDAPTSPLEGEVDRRRRSGEGSSAPISPRPDLFWHAWTLTLELLAGENKDGSRTGTILAHIKRLELIDPNLGDPPWKGRIEAARARAQH
jgi:hypothetical protein